MAGKLTGRKVLVTQADDYMGPQSVETFRQAGAEVIDDRTDLTEPGAAGRVVAAAGHLDVLIANLAAPNHHGTTVADLDDGAWASMFADINNDGWDDLLIANGFLTGDQSGDL